jgi:phosphatidylserine/phosphatidylglycerophosphate/cardiolipin synthase-like enzyme
VRNASSLGRWCVAAAVLLLSFVRPVAAQDLLCDPAQHDQLGRDCRDILIQHIRQETIRLDVAFWFMEDPWMADEIIKRFQAGVPVRILVDTEANASNSRNALRLDELHAAGIPMRERVASGILHWKMMLFHGQGMVEFSGANYSSDAWTVAGADYTNYIDESIYFTSKASLVNSFRTKYDDLWTNTVEYRDYANITAPLTRAYSTFPIDPELNFVPSESHAVRAIGEYAKETQQIDVIMYRITDSRYADAMIDARVTRHLPVRLITEPQQYRDPIRQYHSWNIDRMYMAGIQIRHRAHAGLNHQKAVLLHGQGMTIFGSSNWSSASSESQEEHNLFTTDPWTFGWFTAQFERKWNNSTGVVETAPFTPLPPDAPIGPTPAVQTTGVPPTGVTLGWNGGYWAHKYDVYMGTTPTSLSLVAADVPRATSGLDSNGITLATPLVSGTTYYWRVVGKTMANMTATSQVWSFTTAGVAPPPPTITLAREPYLQQVSANGATIVWTTRQAGTAQVRISPPSAAAFTVAATSTLDPTIQTGLAADYYQHVAHVTGLSASTTYAYDILVSGVDLNTVADTFTTAPPTGSGTVSFVMFGDSGTGSPDQAQIAGLLNNESFDLALHGGDLAYGVSSGTGGATYQTMEDWFFSVYRNWLRRDPVMPSIGNHDSRASNLDGRPYLDMFELPAQGASAAYPDHAERYYSFDYGPMHVIVLDTELAFQDPARQAVQLAWAESDLAATSQPWKIALYHRSPYSAGGEHGSDLPVRAAFAPLFDKYNVQLSLSAHEHDYERTVPLRADVADPTGTTYVVSGGGGAPLYPSGTGTWTAFSTSVPHYLRGTVSDCVLHLEAVGANGAGFDQVTLQRCAVGPDTQAPQVAITSPAPGAVVKGMASVSVTATDNVFVSSVELLVNGAPVALDTQAPFSFLWDSTTVPAGTYSLAARAVDTAGNSATSSAVSVDVQNPTPGPGDIILYAADATVIKGRWQKESDPTAAGGMRMRNPDAGGAKIVTALANPPDYFELTFNAVPNTPYRFWMRGKADGDAYPNDSVFVQFTGTPSWTIGTTSATEYNLEDCSGCRVAGWGWQDNAWGVGVPSQPVTFSGTGPYTMRIQVREDGLSIDQIILSPVKFFSASPGPLKNDTTIYPRSAGTTDPDPDPTNTAPSVALTAPASGATATAPANVSLAATAADTDGTIARVDFFAGSTLIGSDGSSPYQATWTAVPAGTYTLTAHAVDDDGAVTISAPVTLTVTGAAPPPNTAPSVALTGPANGATATAPATFALTASASDTDGTVVKVEFYAGTTLIGSDTISPFAASWSAVPAGTYSLTARAIDDDGAATTSTAVTVTVNPAQNPPPSLPAPWTSQDIGAVGLAGSASAAAGVFTVKGEGVDIWNAADAFHYVSQPLAGDMDIIGRVTSVENVHPWVKAGVMIRQSLTADSAHALMLVSPGKGLAFQRRVAPGGVSTNTSGGSGTAPAWVKLERRGNTITAFRSPDGVAWTLVGSDTFAMPSNVYVGLAVSSHVSGRLATATFDSVQVHALGGSQPPANAPPTVSLTAPQAGAAFTAPAAISLSAAATDSDGTVTKVEFFAGSTLVGTATSSPYSATWSAVPAGSYTLTARATDDDGATTTSAPVAVTVGPAVPPLPAPWASQDIGAVGVAGSASAANGVFTVTGEGVDIWNTADAFRYVWQPLSGDADVIARVDSEDFVHAWVKAGVMIREKLTADSPHGLMLVSPGKGLAFQRRIATGGLSTNTSGGAGTAPAWVKLERRANTITAYRSADGTTWTLVGSDTFTMGPNVFVGLAVSSHVSGRLATATFSNVAVIPR